MEKKTCKICNETKDISKFEKNRCKCKSCRMKSLSKKAVETLPDWYIKKVLKKESMQKNTIFTCSQKLIKLKRVQLIKERTIRNYDLLLMNTINSRKCKTCNQIKNLSYFKDGTKHKRSCYICRNNIPTTLTRLKKYKKTLPDFIIKGNIMAIVNKYLEKDLRIKASEIPQQFIDLKRKELLTKRKIQSWQKQKQ
jgi:hypothetical protein